MQTKFKMFLPAQLRQLRGERSQVQIAKDLGINQQTYARWELGDRQPKLNDLCVLAMHFGVSTDWLLGISVECENNSVWQKRAQDAERKLSKVNTALGHVLKGAKELQSILEDEEQ